MIEKHNSERSLWLLIHNKVYDVTEFKDHPGGYDHLLKNAGTDATEAFDSVGHSESTIQGMSEYMIGFLEDKDRDDANEVQENETIQENEVGEQQQEGEGNQNCGNQCGSGCSSSCPLPWIIGGVCLAGICYIGFKYLKKR